MGNIVAIVGRPNVGKSTLFNRLTESRDAIVHETSGVTRDRHYGKALWNGIEFSVIDTGGYVVNSDDIFEEEIRRQVTLAMEEADTILFIVDVTSGVTDLDMSIAQILRKSQKRVLLAVNKVDHATRGYESYEFHSLGLGELHNISSVNGSGTGDLLDALVATFGSSEPENDENIPRFAVVGRPNVGKSSLINTLVGENRNIVTPVSGTTRDAIHSRYRKYNHDFILIDTAGLRKKTRVSENLEFYSVMRSIKAIENADVCFLMIDATQNFESQDMNIFRLIQKNRKGVVLVINKWDLVEKDSNTLRVYGEYILKRLEPFNDVPLIFISAISKQRIHKVLEAGMMVFENRRRKIPTSRLNAFLAGAIGKHRPPSVRGRELKINYVTQLPTHSPSFAFYCNMPQHVREPYKRYLENQLRKNFALTGVPVQLFFRKK